MYRTAFILASIGTFLLLSSVHRAAAQMFFLDNLIDTGGAITCGDKIFQAFAYTLPLGSNLPPSDKIKVRCIRDRNGSNGIRFEGDFRIPANTTDAALLRYTVLTNDPRHRINGAAMLSDLTVEGGTNGFFGIRESFDVEEMRDLTVQALLLPGQPLMRKTQDATLVPRNVIAGFLRVRLALNAGSGPVGGGVPRLTFIEQSFAQNVPEPGALALLGGLVGVGGLLWRKRR